MFVAATDADSSSVLRYAIVDGNTNDIFTIDRLSGEISVRSKSGVRLDNMATDKVSQLFFGGGGGGVIKREKDLFFKVAPIRVLLSNAQSRTYIHELLPPLGCEPGSLGAVSRCLIYYVTAPHKRDEDLSEGEFLVKNVGSWREWV